MTSHSGTFAPLTYKVPYRRLNKLSRAGPRKLYPAQWLATWGLIVTFFGFLLAQSFWEDALLRFYAGMARPLGWSPESLSLLVFFLVIALFLIAMTLLSRRLRKEHADRFAFDQEVILSPENASLRISTKAIEYQVKGSGIYQLLRERDGVVIVAGGLMFLVPDTAFTDDGHRSQFITHLGGLLSNEARERSAEVLGHDG